MGTTPLKDSGVRTEFETGSRRDTQVGKGRPDLLPGAAMLRLAVHFQQGSEKYGDRNWEKGQPLSQYISSALRHIFKHTMGARDEPHMEAALWNIMCFVDTKLRIDAGLLPAWLDDLPPGIVDQEKLDALFSLIFPNQPEGDSSNRDPRDEEPNDESRSTS